MEDINAIEEEIKKLEKTISKQCQQLGDLKRRLPPQEISDYTLESAQGPTQLSSIFDNRHDLIVIHNMGSSCPYCTMWADGFNGVYDHLISRATVAVVSPDPPAQQYELAQSRGWRFPMYSGENSPFIENMGFKVKAGYRPGVSTFVREQDGRILRIATAQFGPFDPFCGVWPLFALLSDGVNRWQPRNTYEQPGGNCL